MGVDIMSSKYHPREDEAWPAEAPGVPPPPFSWTWVRALQPRTCNWGLLASGLWLSQAVTGGAEPQVPPVELTWGCEREHSPACPKAAVRYPGPPPWAPLGACVGHTAPLTAGASPRLSLQCECSPDSTGRH